MLDIQKELEKFNRLLEEVDDDAAGSADADAPANSVENVSEDSHQNVSSDPRASDLDVAVTAADANGGNRPVTPAEESPNDSDAAVVPVSDAVLATINRDNSVDPRATARNSADGEAALSQYGGVGTRGDRTEDEAGYTEMTSRISAVDESTYVSADDPATDLDDVEEREKSWEVTEHILDSRDDSANEDLGVESAENVDKTSADGPHVIWPVDDRLNTSQQPRFPNPGKFSFEEPVVEHPSEDVDSLLHGARIALTDSHHLRPSRLTPSLTVTLPDPVEVDEEDDLESLSARILPLLTFKAGMFEERLGAVVGAVAGLVILAAGVLFVPRLFSSDDPELIAEASNTNSLEHIHAAADPLLVPEAALLSIATFPPGARVYLNAELIGVTPFRDVAVDRGDYQVSIEKNEFAAIDTFLTLDTAKEFFFDLSEEKGLVSLESGEESDHQLLQVADDANSAGRTARQVSSDRESASNVAVSEPEPRRRESSRSNSSSSENRRARVEAPSLGALVITSEPMGAVVFLDDEAVGETPATLPELTTGRVRLSLQKDGFVPYETEINVMPSIQTPFHAALAPVKASLFVNASPGGDLYVDDQLVRSGITPGHMELVPVGSRNIKIVHPDYGEYVQVVEVTADNKTTVSVDMVTHGFGWSVENGDQLFAESRYQEAIENYQRALAIRPGAGGLNNKIALAAKAMAESNMSSADVRTSDIDGIYSVTDTAPQLIGGLAALHSNVVYPEEAYNEGIQGRVYVQFVVDEQGRAQDITIAKGLQGGCNEAAIQAVKRARFKPATVGGVPVKARHTLFVNFTI